MPLETYRLPGLPTDSAEEPKTKIDKLAVACTNCLRMLNRARPWATIQQLKEVLRQRVSA